LIFAQLGRLREHCGGDVLERRRHRHRRSTSRKRGCAPRGSKSIKTKRCAQLINYTRDEGEKSAWMAAETSAQLKSITSAMTTTSPLGFICHRSARALLEFLIQEASLRRRRRRSLRKTEFCLS
jgi:hypothetical protein